MHMDLQMANARLYEEMKTPSRDRSPSPARVRELKESKMSRCSHKRGPGKLLLAMSQDYRRLAVYLSWESHPKKRMEC